MPNVTTIASGPLFRCLIGAGALGVGLSAATGAPPKVYQQHNLVSDGFLPADVIDPNLVNPWGIAPNPTGVWWVANNATASSTLYDAQGDANPLIVSIPGADGTADGGRPTGIVFSGGIDFVITDGVSSGPARFIFASEDGTISAWAPNVPSPPPSMQAQLVIDNSAEGANYKGLALASTLSGNQLYAADFHNARIDVFNSSFQQIVTAGFVDSQIPARFAPFNVAAINGNIFVAYAMQDATGQDEVAGSGLGFISVFDTNGNLRQRLIRKGHLNAPWAMVVAPTNFGEFSGALLVGNSGDGRINAYYINNGKFLGALSRAPNQPIKIAGLRGLSFGAGGTSDTGDTNVLFFAAGPGDEQHGVFGTISVVAAKGALTGDAAAGE
jgi:uncharacterized protein (TIGR03118 family)